MNSNEVPHRSREYIEERAERALRHYLPRTLERACATPVAELAMLVRKDLGVSFAFNKPLGTNSKGQPVLGSCYFSPQLAIFIDPSLAANGPRFRFTLAHELGHLTLHRALSLDFTSLDASPSGILDGRYDLRMGRRNLESPRDWLEWQANSYAASLLMPRATFAGEVIRLQNEAGVRMAGKVYVDSQPHNIAAYNELLTALAFVYQTSRTAARIRLTELSILKDRRSVVGFGGRDGPVAIGNTLAQLLASGDLGPSDGKLED